MYETGFYWRSLQPLRNQMTGAVIWVPPMSGAIATEAECAAKCRSEGQCTAFGFAHEYGGGMCKLMHNDPTFTQAGPLGVHCFKKEISSPCDEMDCGPPHHGSCVDGRCECESGYFGDHCEDIDRCEHPEPDAEPVNCGEHGVCADGECECEEGWEGERCENSHTEFLSTAGLPSWNSDAETATNFPRRTFTLFKLPPHSPAMLSDGGQEYAALCAEYGLAGIGCPSDFEGVTDHIEAFGGIGMPSGWGCEIMNAVQRETGWTRFFVFAGSGRIYGQGADGVMVDPSEYYPSDHILDGFSPVCALAH